MALLEDEHQGSKRRTDGQEVEHHSLQRQHNRPGEQEEQHVSHEDHRAHGQGHLVVDELDHVDVDRRRAANEHAAVGDGSVGADRLDDIARRVRADLGVGRCLDQHHVLADGARHQLAHGLRKVVRIAGVQLRVLREAEVGVQIVDRARVQDTGDGCDAALERVLIGDAAGRQR